MSSPKLKQQTLQLGKRPREPATESDGSSKRARPTFDSSTSVKSPTTVESGPTTTSPLNVIAPTFDIKSAFTDSEGEAIKKSPGLDLLYFKPFLKPPSRQMIFKYLLEELPWYRVKYKARDMTINTPRWTCVWGSDDLPTSSEKWKRKPRPIPEALTTLKAEVERRTGCTFNFVLCNYYADGNDSITWHSDDEAFLGPLPAIASLSLGAPRDFAMKHKTDKTAKQEKWTLQSGDMIVMRGTTQSQWLHSIPKRASAGGRMNLTFRKVVNAAGTNNYYHYNIGTGPVHRWRESRMVETK